MKLDVVLKLDTVLTGIETFLALTALIVSILVAWQAIRITKKLHSQSHSVSVEEFQRARFDRLFDVLEKVFGSIADLDTDLLPYYPEAAENVESRASSSDESLEYQREVQRTAYLLNVHRSMEFLFAHRISLDVALSGLPTFDSRGRSVVLDSELERAKINLELSASWLVGCVMALYFSMVTKTLADGSTQLETYSAVFGKIENEWDQKGNPLTTEPRLEFLRSVRDGWHGKQKVDESAVYGGAQLEARVDPASTAVHYFLANARKRLVDDAKELSRLYLESQTKKKR